MAAFTAREAARDAYASARSMGRGRVLGADPRDVYAARRMTWLRALARVNAAVGTDRVFVREPDDQQLDAMASHAQGELDALDAAEGRRATAVARELAEPATTLIGPRTWTQTGADG